MGSHYPHSTWRIIKYVYDHILSASVRHNIVDGDFVDQDAGDCDAKEGNYISEWIRVTRIDQETGALVCDDHYLYPAGQSSKWFTKNLEVAKIELKYVLSINVKLENISYGKLLPQRMNISERKKIKRDELFADQK